ncbi:MAG: hypothetical protein QNJ46_04395 [Leptolyngbyaceae cyanobacterium MO_188.B28]|nr:hypothetical protein [Leptolyngbyaceae cyanobacterium MO_188.B28]
MIWATDVYALVGFDEQSGANCSVADIGNIQIHSDDSIESLNGGFSMVCLSSIGFRDSAIA